MIKRSREKRDVDGVKITIIAYEAKSHSTCFQNSVTTEIFEKTCMRRSLKVRKGKRCIYILHITSLSKPCNFT